MTKAHWSERTACVCGKVFKVGTIAEARHRHNFPMLCRASKKPKGKTLSYDEGAEKMMRLKLGVED